MIHRRIEICIGTDRARNVRARLSLLLLENESVIAEYFHSINICPGDDLDALRAANEANIGNPQSTIPGAPWPRIPDALWAEVVAHCAIVQKKEKKP